MSLETHLLMIHGSIIQTTQICKYISPNEFYFLVSIKIVLLLLRCQLYYLMTTTTKTAAAVSSNYKERPQKKQSKCLQEQPQYSHHVQVYVLYCNEVDKYTHSPLFIFPIQFKIMWGHFFMPRRPRMSFMDI